MEHHHQEHHFDSHEIDGHETGDKYASIIEKLKEKYEKKKNGLDELREAFSAGNKERFEILTDDLVYEALTHDENFAANIAEINEIRRTGSNPEREAEIRTEQNALFNTYKQEIISLAGLPAEAGQDEYVVAQAAIEKRIESYLKDGGDIDHVLENLGILTKDEKGQDIFTYPQDLFPSETDKKWELYLDRVANHLRKARGVAAGTLDKVELGIADEQRRLAHDAVTGDVHKLLGFKDASNNEGMSFEETRKLLAKMRDSRYPTVETAEGHRTAAKIIMASNALKALGMKLSDLKK